MIVGSLTDDQINTAKVTLYEGVVGAVGPAAHQKRPQARDRAPACPPSWAPGRDGVSFPKSLSGRLYFYRC